MPKYIPTHEDTYSTKPCAMCGRDVLDEKTDTCSRECELQWVSHKEDWEWFLWKDYEGEEEDFFAG